MRLLPRQQCMQTSASFICCGVRIDAQANRTAETPRSTGLMFSPRYAPTIIHASRSDAFYAHVDARRVFLTSRTRTRARRQKRGGRCALHQCRREVRIRQAR